MLRLSLLLALSCAPACLRAHPHIFVDVNLHVSVDDAGQAQWVDVSWTYDEFYSLLILEDRGLDTDYDGVLTEAELEALDGWDLQWIPGFDGDVYASFDQDAAQLGAPQGMGVDVVEGRIITRHRRKLAGGADGLVLRAYDPTYYTAYALGDAVTVDGACQARIEPANKTAALDQVAAIIRNMNDADVEIQFPEVGELFADRIVIECPD